jgi:hypothetical protein
MGEVILNWQNNQLFTEHSNCWCDRGSSMVELLNQSVGLLNENERKSIKDFHQIFKVGDHGDGEYTVCSDHYTHKMIPCWSFNHWKEAKINDYVEMCQLIKEKAEKKYKYDQIIWAGQVSHPTRKFFIDKYSNNLKFKIISHKDHWGHTSVLPDNYISLPDHCDYKYVLDLQGNGYSARVKFLLHTKRPLFYQARKFNEYWFWKMLPFVHYIPVSENLSDLDAKVLWAESNPEKCQEIANNAYDFALNNLKRSDALNRLKDILIKLGQRD